MILWYFFDAGVENGKVVLIIDAKVGLTEFDSQMLHMLHEAGWQVILVANKFDKIKKSEVLTRRKELQADAGTGDMVIPYSAKTRIGREELLREVLR